MDLGSPKISKHPDNQLVTLNTSVTLKCKASGPKPLFYLWEIRSSSEKPWMIIKGYFGDKLVLNAVQNTSQARCKVFNPGGVAISHVATITVFSKNHA